MIQADYVRDMHNNYLVLKGIEDNVSNFGAKMLLNNSIPGLLKTEIRCIDQMDLFYYDITSKISIYDSFQNKSFSYNELKNILSQIIEIIKNSSDYFLAENDFIIEPGFIYAENNVNKIELCHLVGLKENIQDQLSKFMEYLMNKVDYKDEAAVLLIYAMYKESKELGCTFEKLLKELDKKSNEPKVKKISADYVNKISGQNNSYSVDNNEKTENNNKKIYNPNNKIPVNNYAGNKKMNQKINNYKFQKNIKNNNSNKSNKDSLAGKILLSVQGFIVKWSGSSSANKVKLHNTDGILEEVESEKEIYYYGWKIYLLAALAVFIGVVIFISALQFKILHNSFGTHIDIIKLICCMVIIGSGEVYIFMKLFDKNKKLTRMKTDVEYREPDSYSKPIIPGDNNKNDTQNNMQKAETQLLWTGQEDLNRGDSEQDKTVILTKILPPIMCYLIPADISDKKKIAVDQFPFIIGKHTQGIDLTIENSAVSRRHAGITREGEDIFLTDLSSTNGTYLNGSRLAENKPYLINNNDEITFSQIKYIWSVNK